MATEGVAGIGIEIDLETFQKYGKEDMFNAFENHKDECFDPDDFFIYLFEKEDCMNIVYRRAGNLYSGEIREYLFARDPFDYSQFMYEMKHLGFSICDECDLEFVEDYLIS